MSNFVFSFFSCPNRSSATRQKQQPHGLQGQQAAALPPTQRSNCLLRIFCPTATHHRSASSMKAIPQRTMRRSSGGYLGGGACTLDAAREAACYWIQQVEGTRSEKKIGVTQEGRRRIGVVKNIVMQEVDRKRKPTNSPVIQSWHVSSKTDSF